jgi:uncharacterized protein (TIGR02996 family)
MTDRQAFERSLADNPHDDTTRQVFADWLEESGLDDEATSQREWIVSRDWLRDFARQCGATCTNYREAARSYNRETREQEIEEIYEEITYDTVVQAGHDFISHGDYFVQMGNETARDLLGNGETLALFWKHWTAVTGVPYRHPPQWRAEYGEDMESPFSCSC